MPPLLELLSESCCDLEVTGGSLELSGSDQDAAAWLVGAIAHLVHFHPELQSSAAASMPAACQLLSCARGSTCELIVYLLAALANQDPERLRVP